MLYSDCVVTGRNGSLCTVSNLVFYAKSTITVISGRSSVQTVWSLVVMLCIDCVVVGSNYVQLVTGSSSTCRLLLRYGRLEVIDRANIVLSVIKVHVLYVCSKGTCLLCCRSLRSERRGKDRTDAGADAGSSQALYPLQETRAASYLCQNAHETHRPQKYQHQR